jgi:hypothetical protein
VKPPAAVVRVQDVLNGRSGQSGLMGDVIGAPPVRWPIREHLLAISGGDASGGCYRY